MNRQNRSQKGKCIVTFILENDNDDNYIDIIQIIWIFIKIYLKMVCYNLVIEHYMYNENYYEIIIPQYSWNNFHANNFRMTCRIRKIDINK